MYYKVVESMMAKILKVHICVMTYVLSIYEMKFLAYEVLQKVLNFPLNLLCRCNE